MWINQTMSILMTKLCDNAVPCMFWKSSIRIEIERVENSEMRRIVELENH